MKGKREESEEHAKKHACYAGYWRKVFEPSFTGRAVVGTNFERPIRGVKILKMVIGLRPVNVPI